MAEMTAAQADRMLRILKRTPVFQKNPALADAFLQLNYKRFMADESLDHVRGDQFAAARLVGGACAVAMSEPPADLSQTIADVLDAGRSFLIMTDTVEMRERIYREARAYRDRRDAAAAERGDMTTDGQHRSPQ